MGVPIELEYETEAYAIVTLLIIFTFCREKAERMQSNGSRRRNLMKHQEESSLVIPSDVRPFYEKAKSRLIQQNVITEKVFDELKKKVSSIGI